MKKQKVIIIGSGPAGLTAGIYSARADFSPLIFEGTNPGGQLMQTSDVENFPGFPDGILGVTLIENMRKQAQNFGAETVMKNIDKVDFSDTKNLKLWSGGEEFSTSAVIVATGASARWLDFMGDEKIRENCQNKYWGRGYTACATCDGAFFREKTVCVIGGGDSACEEAHFLTKFAKKIYLIHRRDELRASKPMQKRVMENEKIEIIWNENVSNIFGEKKVEKIELTNSENNKKSELNLDGIFVAIGHIPNTKFLEGQIDLYENGFIKIREKTRTNIPSVFVAGDVSDTHYQQAITASGAGCMAAMDVEKYLENL